MTTTIKTCFKCGAEKPLTEFYKHPMMTDGHLGKCKECTKLDVRKNRKKRIDYYREYDRKRGNRISNEWITEYRKSNAQQTRARNAVNNAVRDGRIIKPKSCSECSSEFAIHGHHDDYSKPLEVRWLCAACHHQWHAKNGPGKSGDIEQIKRKSA